MFGLVGTDLLLLLVIAVAEQVQDQLLPINTRHTAVSMLDAVCKADDDIGDMNYPQQICTGGAGEGGGFPNALCN